MLKANRMFLPHDCCIGFLYRSFWAKHDLPEIISRVYFGFEPLTAFAGGVLSPTHLRYSFVTASIKIEPVTNL
jgi:hypothetical protein